MIRFGANDYPLRAAQIGEAVFAGEILVFGDLTALRELSATAYAALQSAFGAGDLTRAERRMPGDDFCARAAKLQQHFAYDADAKRGFVAALAEIGLNPRDMYLDKIGLRLFASQATHQAARLAGAPIHRDTWGSNIYQQINWWWPLFELQRENTLLIYPRYWRRAVKNNSASWRYQDYQRARQNAQGGAIAYAPTPIAGDAIDMNDALYIDIAPGELLCFSGAHLHGGVKNTSKQTRISMETRSVNQADIDAGRRAPNVDGRYRQTHAHWFRHALSDARLADLAWVAPE